MTSGLGGRQFFKMNGLGNEILVVDARAAEGSIDAAEARAIADIPALRFDQMMVLGAPRRPGTRAYVRIYNRDGSQAGACGNGMRCVADVLNSEVAGACDVETDGGLVRCWPEAADIYSVDMGAPRLRWDEIPLAEPFHDTRGIELQIGPIDAPVLHTPSVVNMGNPHAIFWVSDVNAHDLARCGPLLENHPIFPERANISLAQVVSKERVVARTWERGAGLTRACGSAACAVLVAGARKDLLNREATVNLPGGALRVAWRESDGHVIMTGPVAREFEGRLPVAIAAGTPA
jgi:diaminopimelate epimerase